MDRYGIFSDSSDDEVPPPPPRSDAPGPSSDASGTLEDESKKVKTGEIPLLSEAKIKAVAAIKAAEAEIEAMEVNKRDEFDEVLLDETPLGPFILLKDNTMLKEVDTASFGKFFHDSLESLLTVLKPFTEVPEDEMGKGIIKLSPAKKDKMVDEIRKVAETEITRLLTAILLDRGLKFRTKNKNKKVGNSDQITVDKSGETKPSEITSKVTLSVSSPAIPLTCLCSQMHDLIMSCPTNGTKHGDLCAATFKKGGR